jgi:hypothetical protein
MNRLFDILASIVVVAGITTLVLPGRQSPAVINAGGNAFANALKAATGQN